MNNYGAPFIDSVPHYFDDFFRFSTTAANSEKNTFSSTGLDFNKSGRSDQLCGIRGLSCMAADMDYVCKTRKD